MRFQIREVILWPRDTNLAPRRLRFETGALNVISGTSRTGKSAIIPIIDYCLGSDKCAIPVNIIRNYASWFGVLVETDSGQKLFARREPGSSRSTGDMYVMEGTRITVPNTLSRNANVDAVKRILDNIAGLTALDFDVDQSGSGFQGRPSFRDMSAFTFQPQNIVANPDVFFYKADTYEHREKLKTIFPYVLGAIDPRLLARQHELAQLRKELKRKQSERANLQEVSGRWMADIQSRVSRARELGLIDLPVPPDATREQLVSLLNVAVSTPAENTRLSVETMNEAVAELTLLRAEENERSTEYARLRRRLNQMEELSAAASDYQGALVLQRERLQVSNWLSQSHTSDNDCPVCGSTLLAESETVDALVASLVEIEQSIGTFSSTPPAFDREHNRVREDARICVERLEAVRLRRRALERLSAEGQRQQLDTTSVARFIGSTEQALEVYSALGSDSALQTEIKILEDRVRDLQAQIAEQQVQSRLQRALQLVHANAARLLPSLDAERPNDPVSLSLPDLTIKIAGADREDYLWEIGSGSNWLSYHVAVSLGLQQFFLARSQSPVPSLLIYDQPSQVYFPRRAAATEQEGFDPAYSDEDIIAIRRVFQVIAQVVRAADGRLQVIVLDHADEAVWGQIPGVLSVEEWRDGRKLVPADWFV